MKAERVDGVGDGAKSYRWWGLFVAAMVQCFVGGAAWTIMPVLFLEISGVRPDGLGLSLTELGAIWAMLPLASAFFCIPMGIFGDRYGVRVVVGLGVILAAIAGGFRGMSGGFSSLLIWMFLFGVGYSTITPNLSKFVGMWFPSKELGMANGIALGSYGLGAGLAIQFGGSLLSPAVGGWRNALIILGIASLAVGILWVLSAKSPKSVGTEAAAQGSSQGLFHSMSVALSTKDMWLLILSNTTYMMGYIGVIGFLPMYLVDQQGLSKAAANGYVSILLYVFVFGAIIVPMISDRLGTRRWVYFFSILVNTVAVISTAFLTGPALAVAFIVWGFCTGGNILAYVMPLEHPRIGPSLAGAAIGFMLAIGFFGGFVSPIVGNAIAQKAGGVTAIMLWGLCYLVSALTFLLIRETHPSRASKV